MKNNSKILGIICLALPIFLAACKDSSDEWKLYRESIVGDNSKLHIATFDSQERRYNGTREEYNQENCYIAKKLFEQQPEVSISYWCERE